MYLSYYGLREPPFDLTPNPRYMLLSRGHREALANVKYGITGQKSVTVLTGEVGTGKTTVVRAALATLPAEYRPIVCVNNPTLRRDEFYELLASSFSLTPEAARSKARFLIELSSLLDERQARGQITALVIDEAHKLPSELMEEVRLLANLETATRKLLPVVLVGQPELGDRLERPELRQLKQRVSLRCHLSPLDLRETSAFIAGRIRIAGGDVAKVFTREAVTTVFEHAGGVPRTISVICDNALITGFATDAKPVDDAIVLDVCRDFRLPRVPLPGNGDGTSHATPARGADFELRRARPPDVPSQGKDENTLREQVGMPVRPAGVDAEATGRESGDATPAREGLRHDKPALTDTPTPAPLFAYSSKRRRLPFL